MCYQLDIAKQLVNEKNIFIHNCSQVRKKTKIDSNRIIFKKKVNKQFLDRSEYNIEHE